MKVRISETANPHQERLHRVHYLKTDNKRLYKPFTDKKGLHCEGDRFGYVVDWQISEKKRDTVLVR